MTVEEAIAEIRQQAGQVEMIYYAYALDESQHLIGVVSFRELISAERSRKVREVMRTDYVFVSRRCRPGNRRTIAGEETRCWRCPCSIRTDACWVLSPALTLPGMVQQEAGEDIVKIGGMEALDGPYLEVTFAQMVRKRAGWLAILFVGEMLTATAMGFFSAEIERAVVLALFIPLIISSGGNSGSQATTLVIRAMALGEIRLRDWWRVIRRELAAGVVLGAILGVIGMSRIFLWHALRGTYGPHYAVVALTIGCSLDRGGDVRYHRRIHVAIHTSADAGSIPRARRRPSSPRWWTSLGWLSTSRLRVSSFVESCCRSSPAAAARSFRSLDQPGAPTIRERIHLYGAVE